MTATLQTNAQWVPMGNSGAIPQLLINLAASSQIGRGQFATMSPTTGYASLNDGTSPNQIPAGVGYPAVESGISTVAGAAETPFWIGYSGGLVASTIANDDFEAYDFGTPFYIKDENTPGKLSNYSGSNRSLGGLVMGLDSDGNPILIAGPLAWVWARSVAIANAAPFADIPIYDTLASDNFTERATPSPKWHGLITDIQLVGAAIAADNTDYITLTISKRDGAGGGAVVLGTYDSRAANQGALTAYTPKSFSLSAVAGALNILETDVITVTEGKSGAGKVVSGYIRLVGKVQ